jgi:hypothetical protein
MKTEPIVDHCAHCETVRAFTPAESMTYHGYEEPFPEEAVLATCGKCGNLAVFGRELYGDPERDEISDYYALYPAERRKLAYHVPKLVREAYAEAVRCERGNAHMATVVMVRRALEAIAKDYVPSGRGELFQALRQMHTDGVISDEMKEWADGLRKWGNLGAHATTQKVTPDDAKHALDYLEALMRIIYELRPKFEAWQQSHVEAPTAKPMPIPTGQG